MMNDAPQPADWDEPPADMHCDEPDCRKCHPYTLEDYAP